MITSDLGHLNATVSRLDLMLREIKASFELTSWSPSLKEQALQLHINNADKELDKIRTVLTSLRARLAITVTSIDAAVVAREKKEAAVEKMMAEAEKKMAEAEKKKAEARMKMEEAEIMIAKVNTLMRIAQGKNAAAQRKIDTAVVTQNSADVALATLQQSMARCMERWDELRRNSIKALDTVRRALAEKKLQKIKLEAEFAEQLEANRSQRNYLEGDYVTQLLKNTDEFKEIIKKRGEEVRENLVQARKT